MSPITPSGVMSWLPVIAFLIEKGIVTVADVAAALKASHGTSDADTEAADNAALLVLKGFVAGKYGEAVALSHFGE